MTDCQICRNPDNKFHACRWRENNCPNYGVYPRLFLQYNDLVFSGTESVKTASLSGDYVISTLPKLFSHGSYANGSFYHGALLMGEQDLTLDLELPFAGMTRGQVRAYHKHIQDNLSRTGRIWAIDPGAKLVWAWAIPKHPPYSDYEMKNGKTLGLQMDFLLPEGVWHLANTANVFLEPWGDCDFTDELDDDCTYQYKIDPTECCKCPDLKNWCEVCWNPYDRCTNRYRIVYSEIEGEKRFGKLARGYQFMADGMRTAGTFTSNGAHVSPVTVTLLGQWVDPRIEVNERTIRLIGHFDGKLVICGNKVTYFPGEPCQYGGCGTPVPFDRVDLKEARANFRAFYGRNNQFIVSNTNHHHAPNMIYILVDELVP